MIWRELRQGARSSRPVQGTLPPGAATRAAGAGAIAAHTVVGFVSLTSFSPVSSDVWRSPASAAGVPKSGTRFGRILN